MLWLLNEIIVVDFYRIGKAYITATCPKDAENSIIQSVKEGRDGYICVSNVRTVLYANKHQDYLDVMENAMICLPDGMPLVWMARLWGLKEVQRTDGPDLFVSLITNPANGLRHFLLGDTDETLNTIREKYHGALIVGTYSPPFCPLEEFDLRDISERINNSCADIVWISMRAPKQDFLAARLQPLLDKKISLGVGAAFRFALGEYQHPSKIVQKLGLTGLVWRKNKFELLKDTIVRAIYLVKWGSDIICQRIKMKYGRKIQA